MALICVASATGSPGATTVSLALLASLSTEAGSAKAGNSANLPNHLLVEATQDGGILAIRYQLSTKPGLISLASAERYELNIEKLFEHTQKLPGGMHVILAPDSPELAYSALETSAEGIARTLQQSRELTTVVDCGRLQSSSPVQKFCQIADYVVMVSHPESEKLIPASHLLKNLGEQNANAKIGWALLGDAPYTKREVEETFGFPVFGTLPDDAKAARILQTGGKPKKFAKSKLMKSVQKLLQQLSVKADLVMTGEEVQNAS